jgi:hypothetical protein
MKTILFFIASLLFTSNQKTEESKKFENYFEKFRKTDLPFKIDRNNLFSFDKMIYDKDSNIHKLNVYPELDKKYFDYLILNNNENVKYRFCFSIKGTKNYKAVVIIRDVIIDDEDDQSQVWLDLYTYNNEGEIIDLLTLAGYEIDVKEQFVFINNNYEIQIDSFTFLPNPKDDFEHIFANQTTNKYAISSNGKITLTSSNVKNGKFKLIDGIYTLV